MLARSMVKCGVAFRGAPTEKSDLSSRASRHNTVGLHVPLLPRSTPIEGVGFELSV